MRIERNVLNNSSTRAKGCSRGLGEIRRKRGCRGKLETTKKEFAAILADGETGTTFVAPNNRVPLVPSTKTPPRFSVRRRAKYKKPYSTAQTQHRPIPP